MPSLDLAVCVAARLARRVASDVFSTKPNPKSGVGINRASRTGPLAVTNAGTELIAPSKFASATCGLGIGFCGLAKPGLLPPMAGWVWHIVQLFPLNV